MPPTQVVARIDFEGDRVFELVTGDLLHEPVDVIVNAANGHLAHGGGVAAVIARAAGAEFEEEGARLVRRQGEIPVGGAVATGAGRLPFQAVVHAVGPRLGEGDEEAKLVQALTSAFACAAERKLASLSFPAVSSGIFAVPLPVCARAYVRAVREFFAAQEDASLVRIRLCLLPGPLVDLVRKELGR